MTKNYKNLKSKIFFRTKFFFLGLCRFSAKIDKIVKKCQSQKFLVEIFLVGSDSVRMFQNVFQIENFEIEKFSRVTFFWDSVIFYQNSVLIHRNRRSFQFRARLPNYRLQPSSECISEFKNTLALLINGIPIGFSRLKTMFRLPDTDQTRYGDIAVLKPTIIAMPPLLIENVKKLIEA